MDEHFYEYRTGQTSPQKNSRGLVAFLLICIIFLCGMISVLSAMNIRLFRQLQQADSETPVSFSEGDILPTTADALSFMLEGMTLQELPSLYQKVYDLPEGLYVSHVTEGSKAEQLGIVPGNVLTAVNGVSISQLDALQELLIQSNGYWLELTLFQNGSETQIPLTLND